jgi:class 3 adenylate cyclase
LTRIGLLDIVHPQCKGDYLTHFTHVLRGNILEGIKTELITKSGRKISIEGSLNCKWVDGKAVAVRGIFRDITDRLQSELALKHQQEKTERLLLNILPQTIAERLKRDAATIAEHYADVSVLFADLVGFTRIAAELSPIDLVRLLNQIFSAFDRLTEERGLEKIKTVGDAYMVVGGLPHRRPDHAEAIAQMALDMQAELEQFNLENEQNFNIRIGIHTGPVVAGVIGLKKFIYDLWGDTVNTASRMESHGLPGRIQVTQDTYERLKDDFILEKRGAIEIKGKGEMITYFLNGRLREQLPSERRRDRLKALKRLGIVSEPTQQLLDMLENRLADSP